MPPLATAAGVKAACNLPDMADAAITPWLARAESMVRAHVGSTVYEDVAAAGDEGYTGAYTATDLASLTRGENLLCGSVAVLLATSVTSGHGMLGIVGGGQGGGVPVASQSTVQAVSSNLAALGWAELEPYWKDGRAAARASGGAVDPSTLNLGAARLRAPGV